ncbi:MAG: HlyD family efflux transporter periplasmic adaptor subunit, partial [Proteobacteria bacterium]|nr:HlyD family efflux transporter periplasmic adaptor subunit [Pseudomonadota bacterium]
MALRSEKFHVRALNPIPSALNRVIPRRNYRLFFGGFFLLFVILGIALLLLPWQQTAKGNGRVIAYSPNDRAQEINAPIDGRIQKWHVVEGSKIKEGEPIVDLSDNDPEIIERLRQERDALAKRVMAAEAAVQTAKINVDRQDLLVKKGLSARRAFEQANLDYTKFLVDEANASAELARMDVRLSRQLTQSVKAPVPGTILKIISGQGAQIVKSGQMLAVLVPETESRAVELWIQGNDVPLIRENAEVRLQFEGWPAIQFSGWPGAAYGTYGGKVALIDASDNGQGKFRIVITPLDKEPWPEGTYLRQGARALGWVLLNRVTLGYELWRRFNG